MKTPYKMYGKSPMMKALIGKQNNLPEELKAKIIASDSPMDMYGKSPVKNKTGEVVSKNSPGAGWTKTKGTNIWAPPAADKKMLGQKKGKLQYMKDSIKKVARPSKKSTITDNKSMKPPYKKPVGPRA